MHSTSPDQQVSEKGWVTAQLGWGNARSAKEKNGYTLKELDLPTMDWQEAGRY